MSEDNLPVYVATDEFLFELRELGYEASIELDDLIDFLDEDPSYIEQMRLAVMMLDEVNFLSRTVAEWYYNRRPT